jgi:hypothetical protein
MLKLIKDFKTASYAELLADSEPCDAIPPINGRRDIQRCKVLADAPFWAQNAQKIAFLKRASETVTDHGLNQSIKTAIKIAETTVVSPGRAPYGRYYLDSAGGVWAAENPEDEPVQVYNLKGLMVQVDNPRYQKPRAREWVNEHDSWHLTTDKFQGTRLGNLDKHDWLESRLFSLDLEGKFLLKLQQQGLPSLSSSRVAPSANSFNPLAAEFVPSKLNAAAKTVVPSPPASGSRLNAKAPEFVPSPPARMIKLNVKAPEFVPCSPNSSVSMLNAKAPEFVPSPPARIIKLNVKAPEFVPQN